MKNYNKMFRIGLVCIYLLAFGIVLQNLNFQYLWFDEAGQFWISKGLNHDSQPLSAEGGLSEVIENNKYYNMDPGGFGIILHYWSLISNHHAWLRLLPFLFFVSTVILFISLIFRWTKNFDIAVLIGFIPIFTPFILNMGFETRAYSMETLGTLFCVLVLYKLKENLNSRSLILWSFLLSIFITSRYSSILIVFVTSVYVLYLVFQSKKSTGKKLGMLVVYALPLFISLAWIYLFAYSFQKGDHKQLPYLQFLSNNPLVIFKPANLVYILFVAFCGILYIKRKRYEWLEKYAPLLFLTVSANVLFVVLSYAGFHPWRISKSCISIVLLTLMCFGVLLAELLLYFDVKNGVKYSLLLVLLAYIVYEKDKNLFPRHEQRGTPYSDLKTIDLKTYKSIYVECWESPCIRYLFEYGDMKKEGQGMYPGNFTFAKGVLHSNYSVKDSMVAWAERTPEMNELPQYDLIITSKLWDWSAKKNEKWKRIANTNSLWVKREE